MNGDVALNGTVPSYPQYREPPRPARPGCARRGRFGFESYADFLDLLGTKHAELADSSRSRLMAREARLEADQLAQRPANSASDLSGRDDRAGASAIRMPPRRLWALVVRQYALLLTRRQSESPPDSRFDRKLKNAWFRGMPLIIAAGSAALAALVAGKPGLGAAPSPMGPTALALLTTLCVLSGQALTYTAMW